MPTVAELAEMAKKYKSQPLTAEQIYGPEIAARLRILPGTLTEPVFKSELGLRRQSKKQDTIKSKDNS